MSDYLTNLAQRALKPTAVRPRLRPLYADRQIEPVQEIFEETDIEQARPADQVAAPRPPLVTEPPSREDRTQHTPTEPATTRISQMEQGLEEAVRLVPKRTEAEPAREAPPVMSKVLVARIDVGAHTSALDPQSEASDDAHEEVRILVREVAPSDSRQGSILRTHVNQARTTLSPKAKLDEHEARERPQGNFHTLETELRTVGDLSPRAMDSARSPQGTPFPRATAGRQEELPSNKPRVLNSDTAVASESSAPAISAMAQAAGPRASRTDSVMDGEHEAQAGLDAPQSQEGLRIAPVARRASRREPESRDDGLAAQETTIEISIGRIDIRAATAPESAKRRSAGTSPAKSSLDLYLEKQRAGGRG